MSAGAKLAVVAVVGAGAALAARALRASARPRGAGPQAQAVPDPLPSEPIAAGGQPAAPGGPAPRNGAGPTRVQLYEEAKRRDIEGRSTMTKAQLAAALEKGDPQ